MSACNCNGLEKRRSKTSVGRMSVDKLGKSRKPALALPPVALATRLALFRVAWLWAAKITPIRLPDLLTAEPHGRCWHCNSRYRVRCGGFEEGGMTDVGRLRRYLVETMKNHSPWQESVFLLLQFFPFCRCGTAHGWVCPLASRLTAAVACFMASGDGSGQ